MAWDLFFSLKLRSIVRYYKTWCKTANAVVSA